MTITVIPNQTFSPPRNSVTIAVPAGQIMSSVSVWRNDPTGRTQLRTQPVAGFLDRLVYDYECPYDAAVTYGWSASFFDQAEISTVWTEAWASLAAWTAAGGSWSVSGGKLVWSAGDNLAASMTRAVAAGQYEILLAAPPFGLSSINFGGFYIDVANARLVLGSATVSFDPGVSTWTIGVSDASVSITTSAGVYTVPGSSSVTQVSFVGAVSKVVWASKWGTPGTGNGQFDIIRGIVTDAAGYIYVTDEGNSRIQKFTSAGVYVTKWGTPGTGNGQFSGISDIAIDTVGNIYVVDSGNARIQRFDPPGSPTNPHTYSTKWGTPGSGDGQFMAAGNIAVDSSSNVYVTDNGAQRVQKFTSSGTFITKWGSYGTTDGAFLKIAGIAVDSIGGVYVADTGGNRIQKFTAAGAFVLKWGVAGTNTGQFRGPYFLATDTAGNVFVSDFQNDRVQVFTGVGAFVKTFGSPGVGDGQFTGPANIAVSSAGAIVVADLSVSRVQTFTQTRASIDDVTLKAYGITRSTIEEESTAVILSPADGWLIHPANPALSFPLADSGARASIRSIGDISNVSKATVHEIMGSDFPITTTNGNRGADNTSLTIEVTSREEEASIKALLRDETPILVNLPNRLGASFDYGFYQVGDTDRGRLAQIPDVALRDYILPLQQVQSPIVTQQNVGWSWASMRLEFGSWDAIKAAFASWADMASNTRRTGF